MKHSSQPKKHPELGLWWTEIAHQLQRGGRMMQAFKDNSKEKLKIREGEKRKKEGKEGRHVPLLSSSFPFLLRSLKVVVDFRMTELLPGPTTLPLTALGNWLFWKPRCLECYNFHFVACFCFVALATQFSISLHIKATIPKCLQNSAIMKELKIKAHFISIYKCLPFI